MEVLEDGILAFFTAVGAAACVWLLAGAFLRRSCHGGQRALLVLPVRDSAPAMESDLRRLLQTRYDLPDARIVLADCGLDGPGRETAEYLCRRYAGVELRSAENFKLE
jgi:hypothetical protein